MAFDLEMIKSVYNRMAERVDDARKVVKKPLTLSEKYCITICGMVMQKLLL